MLTVLILTFLWGLTCGIAITLIYHLHIVKRKRYTKLSLSQYQAVESDQSVKQLMTQYNSGVVKPLQLASRKINASRLSTNVLSSSNPLASNFLPATVTSATNDTVQSAEVNLTTELMAKNQNSDTEANKKVVSSLRQVANVLSESGLDSIISQPQINALLDEGYLDQALNDPDKIKNVQNYLRQNGTQLAQKTVEQLKSGTLDFNSLMSSASQMMTDLGSILSTE